VGEREQEPGRAVAPSAPATSAGSTATPGKTTLVSASAAGQPVNGTTQSIPQKQRATFEKSLKRDLGNVRLHTGPQADALAKQNDARAFAVGQDIYFADGELDPGNPEKERLLAHEVAHVVQQVGAAMPQKLTTTEPGDAAETNADAAASKMMEGQEAKVEPQATASLAREKPGEKKKELQPVAKAVHFSGVTFEGVGQKPNAKWRQDLKDDNVPDDDGPSQGREKVSINAPGVTIKATAKGDDKLAEEEFGAQPIEVGFIQNVTSLSRHGIYKKGDKQVAEYAQDAKKAMHDHMTVGDTPRIDVRNWAGKPPFYGPPSQITNRLDSKAISMYDRPGYDLPMKYGGGHLAEIRGADRFTTTVAAKRGEEIHKAESREWAIPWNMQIQTNKPRGQLLGEGSALEDAKKTDKHVTELGGKTAFDLGDGIILESLDAAMATDFHWLLMELPRARGAKEANLSDKHVKTYEYMLQALRAKDATYQLTLAGSEFGVAYDNYKITVRCGAREKVMSGKTDWFGSGATTSFRCSEVVDYDKYGGEKITAKVNLDDKKASDEINITMSVQNAEVKIGGSTFNMNGYNLSCDVQSKGA
jgi:hypothetical protein